MGSVLCIVAGWFSGNTGMALASIAVTIVGIGALLGKVSWGMGIIVGIGVSIIFGATSIANAMGGGAGGCSASDSCPLFQNMNVGNASLQAQMQAACQQYQQALQQYQQQTSSMPTMPTMPTIPGR